MIPFEADGNTFQSISRLHVPPSNAIQGRKPCRGMVKEVETPSGIRFDDTTSRKSAIGAEAPNGEHSSNHGNGQQPVSVKKAGGFPESQYSWKIKDCRPCEGETPPCTGHEALAAREPLPQSRSSWATMCMRRASSGPSSGRVQPPAPVDRHCSFGRAKTMDMATLARGCARHSTTDGNGRCTPAAPPAGRRRVGHRPRGSKYFFS
ncbi:hypothetical protein GQ55_2G303600 [Panicum hallii var. hallii]|uniref:Uncharacterized protein n=1 Tax=Panicum hallii var. hallii TaxID=1504633 RepID=A0A2T7EU04_9POAL|nr:hypothetical protein GQ55_2G303600 [Panicum hallii var. hallii]